MRAADFAAASGSAASVVVVRNVRDERIERRAWQPPAGVRDASSRAAPRTAPPPAPPFDGSTSAFALSYALVRIPEQAFAEDADHRIVDLGIGGLRRERLPFDDRARDVAAVAPRNGSLPVATSYITRRSRRCPCARRRSATRSVPAPCSDGVRIAPLLLIRGRRCPRGAADCRCSSPPSFTCPSRRRAPSRRRCCRAGCFSRAGTSRRRRADRRAERAPSLIRPPVRVAVAIGWPSTTPSPSAGCRRAA